MAEKKQLSKFLKMKKANKRYCDNPSDRNKKRLDNSINAYVKDAVGKGKTKTEARDVVKNNTGCKVKK